MTPVPIFPPLVGRLIPRLATDQVGELLATRDALMRSLGAAGLDLHDLAAACSLPLAPTTSSARSSRTATSAGVPSFGDLARACRDLDRGRLAAHEKAFVLDMCRRGFGFRPSPRQESWLTAIFDRLQTRAAA